MALCALVPQSAHSETNWSVAPSVSVSERRDDNLFSRSEAPEQDWITELAPGLIVSGRSVRWSVEAGYRQQAERYADHPQLDTASARREASLRWESRATRTLDTTLTASYLQTTTASELYASSGLDFGRLPARRLQLTPALAQGLSRTTTLLADLTATRDEVVGISTLDSAVAGMRLNHRISPRGQLSVRGQARWYEPGEDPGFTSQLLAVGYRHEIGRGLELSFDVGPSFSRGDLGAEWLGSLHSRGRRAEWAIEWGQGENPVIGVATPVVTQRLGASVSGSARALRGRLALDLLKSRGGVEADTVQASAEANLRLAEPLAVTLATAWSRQRGGVRAANPGDIRHLVTELRLVVEPRRRRGDVDVR
jgi:Putative beta-barrel porin 2